MPPEKKVTPVKTAKKGQKNSGLVIQNITIKQPTRQAVDINVWRQALITAESTTGRRVRLYDLYEDLMLDNILGDAIDKRIKAVTNSNIIFSRNGEAVPEMDDMIDSDDFELLLEEIINSKFWGISLMELDFSEGLHVDSIPRKHINPKLGQVLLNQSDTTGIPYRDDPFFLEVGQCRDLGLILKAAPYVIYKRGGFGDWAQFAEIFGMPFRHGTYDAYDEYTRKQLEEAMSKSGGAPWMVSPKGGNVEYIENHSSGNGQLYKLLKDACNEEILIGILGQTMTTVSGSSRAQSDTHKEVENSVNKADRRFVQRILNRRLLPILEARGFPVKDGKFGFPESSEDISLADRFTIDSGLNEMIDIPEDYLYDTYGIPKPTGKVAAKKAVKEPPANPPGTKTKLSAPGALEKLLSFFLKPPTAGHDNLCPMCGGTDEPLLKLAEGSDNSSMIESIAERIYNNEISPKQTSAELAIFTSDILMKALQDNVSGFDDLEVDDQAKLNWIDRQQNNIYAFGLAKSYAQMNDMRNQVIGEDGKIKPFTEFLKDVMATNADYNKTWLETEHMAVVRGTVMGTRWLDIEDQKDVTPYLQYVTAGDSRVRMEHQALEGIIEKVDSGFWAMYYPPNGWRCRCSVRQLSARQGEHAGFSEEDHTQNMNTGNAQVTDPYWRKNTGKAAILEADKTAYIAAVPGKGKKELRAVDNYGMKPSDEILQNSNLPKVQRQSKEDFEKWWKLQADKGSFDVKDYSKIPMRFDEKFKAANTKKNFEVASEAIKIVKDPDEVWASKSGKTYIKYYQENPVVLFLDKKGRPESIKEVGSKIESMRVGILLKRK